MISAQNLVKIPNFRELAERARRQTSMEQIERAWLVEVKPLRTYAYPQHYIVRSTSADDAIEVVKKYCWVGEYNKAQTKVLGHLSHAATQGICQLYRLPIGGVLAWPDSKIELLGLRTGV